MARLKHLSEQVAAQSLRMSSPQQQQQQQQQHHARPSGASKARQFAAVLHKNAILQVRQRQSFLGLGGVAALCLQILLPALFFTLMCIPKYYIQPYEHPVYLQQSESDIDTRWWAGASPYEGPALAAGGRARVAFVPDSPEVSSLVRRIAMAVSCPSEAYKRICSTASITTFGCLFGLQQAPPQCQNATACMMSPECYQPALQDHLLLLRDEAAVEELLLQQPNSLDAVVVFPEALERAAAAAAAAGGGGGGDGGTATTHASAQPAATAAAAPTAPLISPRLKQFPASSFTPTPTTTKHPHQPQQQPQQPDNNTKQEPQHHQKRFVGCGAPGPPEGDGLLLHYVIRMNASDVPPTQLLQDLFDVSPGVMPLPGNLLWEYRAYWFFVNLQLAIDRSLLGGQQSGGDGGDSGDSDTSSGGGYPAPLSVKVKPFPWPGRQEDLGAASAAAFFNLLLVYAFMAPTRAVVGSIVREKELRLREGMRILGLSEPAYWWSWSVTHWLTLAASGLLCAVVGLYPFRHSSFALMLAFYWLFSAALISFSYFLSTLFSASRVAGTATQFIYALSMIPGFLLPFVRPYGGLSWYLAGLSPTSAASLFAAALVNWERLAAGVTLDTMWLPVTPESSFCVGSVMWLMSLDVVLFALLTWYCDKVVPQPHGQTLPFWFPFTPSYWRQSAADISNKQQQPDSNSDLDHHHHQQQQLHEPLLTPMQRNSGPDTVHTAAGDSNSDSNSASAAYIRVCGLRKVFHSSEGSVRVALKGLNMDIAAGRITALLGHNGAAKTTTIHMLTGMLQPTSGTAFIGGLDIRTHMPVIRESLGICPQFDILWPDITAQEHLQLYALLKGARGWREAAAQAQAAAAEVGLSDKLGCLASELSGGQRRKLSVAIAFLGDPAVVFLDEPTSGMDPYSRRATWDVIRRRRHSSVIVLTTHSMEEADLLCDDIHILAEGRLVASGTPLSLKTRYGVGYTLTVVLQQQQQQQVQQAHKQHQQPHSKQKQQQGLQAGGGTGGGSSSSLCSSSSAGSLNQLKQGAASSSSSSRVAQAQAAADGLMSLIQSHIPSAQLLSAAGSEVSVRLPKEAAAAFPAVLRALDGATQQLGVSSYGLSVTTLEEVFLAIADQAVALDPHTNINSSSSSDSRRRSRDGRADSGGRAGGGNGVGVGGSSSSSSSRLAAVTGRSAADTHTGLSSTAEQPQQQNGCDVGDEPSASLSPPPQPEVLSGAALYWQQLKALFVKRALCARRDRLAVITQLLVPLLLVLLAMAVSTLQTQRHQQPPLQLSRGTCLMGRPALLAAAPGLRQQKEVQGLMDGYPRGDLSPTLYTHLYHGSSGPALNLTLEGQLLSQWASGHPHFDALFLQSMPPVDQLLSSLSVAGPSLTLLVNQSAVSGLPASLNQVSSALLRLIVAAGGGKSSALVGRGGAKGVAKDGSGVLASELLLGQSAVGVGQGENEGGSGSHSGGGSDTRSGDTPSSVAGGGAGGVSRRRSHLPSCMPVITAVSSPLPLMAGEKAQRVRQDAGALMLVLCMTLAASVLSASFVVFLVREADNSSKHLQLISGAAPTAYWLANFTWDLINFCLPAAGIVLLVYCYHQPQLSGVRLVAMALLLLAFGGAGINLTYLCHFMFVDEMKALQRLNTVYFLTGYLGFLTTWILGLIATILARPALGAAADRTKAVLRLVSPHYCFAQGLYDITNTAPGSGAVPIPGLPHGPSSPFTYSVLGSAVLHLAAQTLLFGAATVLLDTGVMQLLRRAWRATHRQQQHQRQHHQHDHNHQQQHQQPPGSKAQEGLAAAPVAHKQGVHNSQVSDEEMGGAGAAGGLLLQHAGDSGSGGSGGSVDADVAAERCAVEAGEGVDQAMVVLDGIHKAYPQGQGERPVVAVSGLWLRVWPGECFGLLGVNGAGKSTTFKILTGEVTPDAGDATISHFSVLAQLASARQRLGYCPQFEALPAAMTGREVLTMYARLRGMEGAASIAAEVAQLLRELGLVQYADVACGSYSGGNKRKLSAAVALVGNPPLVLLDEPSTGMDPAARRFLWKVLQSQVLSAGRTIILTSHSMEEVDALADRLVIMAAGSARCLGTPQHLKTTFGDGYTLELRVGLGSSAAADSATAGAAVAVGVAAEGQSGSAADPQAGRPAQLLAAATDRAQHFFESAMPGTVLLEKEPGRLLLRLPLGTNSTAASPPSPAQQQQQSSGRSGQQHIIASLSDVFEAVEGARGSLGISEYSLAQDSLERVFLSLVARAASQADEQAGGD